MVFRALNMICLRSAFYDQTSFIVFVTFRVSYAPPADTYDMLNYFDCCGCKLLLVDINLGIYTAEFLTSTFGM